MTSRGWERSLVFVALGLAPAAWAQQVDGGFNAHGFHLAAHDGDIRDPLVTQRPGPFTQGDFFFSGLAEYAKAPLVLVTASESGVEQNAEAVLDNVLALNLSAGVAVHDHVRFDVKAPVYGLTLAANQFDLIRKKVAT